MQNARAELLLVRVLGEKFIATLQCFVRNLLMYQNGKVCVFFIKMLHSINPICRKDTGGDAGTQLRKLSLLSLGRPGPVPQLREQPLSPALLSLLLLLLLHASLLPWKRASSSHTVPTPPGGEARKGRKDLCHTSLGVWLKVAIFLKGLSEPWSPYRAFMKSV